MQLLGIILLILVGLSGFKGIIGKKCALFQTIEKASAKKSCPILAEGHSQEWGNLWRDNLQTTGWR
jgi:hypothetical protein